MRAIIQRVISASVTGKLIDLPSYPWIKQVMNYSLISDKNHLAVDNEIISKIGRGFMVLVGIATGV